MKINLNKIKNLIVRKALEGRARDFVFFGGKDNREDHVDYCDYSESFWHSDSDAVVHKDYIKDTSNDPYYKESASTPHPDWGKS